MDRLSIDTRVTRVGCVAASGSQRVGGGSRFAACTCSVGRCCPLRGEFAWGCACFESVWCERQAAAQQQAETSTVVLWFASTAPLVLQCVLRGPPCCYRNSVHKQVWACVLVCGCVWACWAWHSTEPHSSRNRHMPGICSSASLCASMGQCRLLPCLCTWVCVKHLPCAASAC